MTNNATHVADGAFSAPMLQSGRIQPWALLREGEFLLEADKLGDIAEKNILERLQRYGLVILRLTAFTPEPALLDSLENLLGPACDQQNDFFGKIKGITPDPGKEPISGESGRELGPHVDGTQEPDLPPAMLAFQYMSGATHGGHSTFFDMANVLQDLKDDERKRIVRDLAHYDAGECTKEKKRDDGTVWRGSYTGPLVKTVLSDSALSFRVRFDQVMRPRPSFQESFDKLQSAVTSRGQDRRVTFMPRVGDVAIFDNWRVMHGRLQVSGRHERHHNRIWFSDLAARHKGSYLLGVRGFPIEELNVAKAAARVPNH